MKQVAGPKSGQWKNPARKKTNHVRSRGRTRTQIRIPKDLIGAQTAPMPVRIDAKLATLVKEAPTGDQWLHEIKFDGYRMLCRIDKGHVEIFSRNQKNWTKQLPTLVEAAAGLPVSHAILDGELVAFEENGVSNFQTLQNAFREGAAGGLTYYAFDLLYLDGTDLRAVALEDRKKLLEELIPASTRRGMIRLSEHVVGHGPEFFRHASELGLEGIVCKLRDRPYTAGRDLDWLKVKVSHREEFVIGAFTDPGVRGGFGALLLGYHDETGQLKYAGKVGTGFTDTLLSSLRARLDKLVQTESPFVDLRRTVGEGRGAHWVKPILVAQVAFSEWTEGGHLRHPSFLGLREDKPAASVVRDTALSMKEVPGIGKSRPSRASNAATNGKGSGDMVSGVHLTHPDKVLFSDGDITKRELAEYYVQVARWILPHVTNRMLSLVRCPEGAGKECFFQKHPGVATPKTIRVVPFQEKNDIRNYLVVDKVEDLVSLAQIGALELHVWGSQVDKLEYPDRMVFDLDPDPTVKWPLVVESAHQIRAFLEEIGLQSFVKTTGGKGLHIVVPLQRRQNWDEVKAFSKSIADLIAQAAPQQYTSNMAKSSRVGRIFIDYLRNGRTATAVCAYSTRAKPRAPVSVPLAWDELTAQIHADTYTVRNLMNRLNRLKHDPWAEIGKVRQSLSSAVLKKAGIASR